jgi:hypothetical protein
MKTCYLSLVAEMREKHGKCCQLLNSHLILAEVVLCAVGVDWFTEATDCLDADLKDPYSEPVF